MDRNDYGLMSCLVHLEQTLDVFPHSLLFAAYHLIEGSVKDVNFASGSLCCDGRLLLIYLLFHALSLLS